MYENSDVNVYLLDINSIFSDMENLKPGFGEAIFTCTITESLRPLQEWLEGIRDVASFKKWLGVIFSDCSASTDISIVLPKKFSDIYLKTAQIVESRLRGLPVYVVCYTTGKLLLASKSAFSKEALQKLLGGLL